MSLNFNSTRCFYCERKFDNKIKKTKEHIIPKSKGGNNNLNNLVYACIECNELRGNMEFYEFKDYLQNIINKNKSIKIKNYSLNRLDISKIINNI